AVLALVVSSFTPCFAQPQSLDSGERVRYQQAIEEVYWQHRTWPQENPGAKPSLGEVITPEQMRTRAEEGARLSNALVHFWRVDITGNQLQMEVDRIVES